MKYAMIMRNRVIGFVEQDTIPNWPPDNKGNVVSAIPCNESVKVGMIYDKEKNSFSKRADANYIPSQATRIELMLLATKEEVENAAIDAYTEELIEGGLL